MTDAEKITRHWLGRLTNLRPATGRGNTRGMAPHKPLFLLCLIDMAEMGNGLSGRTFVRTPSLVLRFRTYGSFVADRWPTKLDLRLRLLCLPQIPHMCREKMPIRQPDLIQSHLDRDKLARSRQRLDLNAPPYHLLRAGRQVTGHAGFMSGT